MANLRIIASYFDYNKGASLEDHIEERLENLGAERLFTEETPYRPNSPYSATKAASDHLVRAWHHTYGLPIVTSNPVMFLTMCFRKALAVIVTVSQSPRLLTCKL